MLLEGSKFFIYREERQSEVNTVYCLSYQCHLHVDNISNPVCTFERNWVYCMDTRCCFASSFIFDKRRDRRWTGEVKQRTLSSSSIEGIEQMREQRAVANCHGNFCGILSHATVHLMQSIMMYPHAQGTLMARGCTETKHKELFGVYDWWWSFPFSGFSCCALAFCFFVYCPDTQDLCYLIQNICDVHLPVSNMLPCTICLNHCEADCFTMQVHLNLERLSLMSKASLSRFYVKGRDQMLSSMLGIRTGSCCRLWKVLPTVCSSTG